MFYDYHLHSEFSADCDVSMERIIKSAIDKGLREICFTEHKDLDMTYEEWSSYYNDGPYTGAVELMQKKYGSRLSIKKGVELDFQSDTEADFEEFLKNHSFDFVLASVHAVEHDFIFKGFFDDKDEGETFRKYFKEVHSLTLRNDFDVLGHFDYIKRFAAPGFEKYYHENAEVIKGSILNLIKNGRGMEINMAGLRHDCREPYPNPLILKLYRESGGEIVTMGSDSHNESDVASGFSEGVEVLKSLGFDGIYSFNKRKGRKILFEEMA